MNGFVIAGTHSGVGKTSIAKGLMLAFKYRAMKVQPFKVGPDFIDPLHHEAAIGNNSHNLDGWMLSKEDNVNLFRRHASSADMVIVEGVMGLFDGYRGRSESGSSAEMASNIMGISLWELRDYIGKTTIADREQEEGKGNHKQEKSRLEFTRGLFS